jgi:NhaP-type Na+/H+ or K+/H+ antiporter
MLIGIAELIFAGLLFEWVFRKLKLPGLVGLLVLGVLVGPFGLALLNDETRLVSADLRLLALVVILLRAGFEMSREALNKVGFRAFLMAFIPCVCEVAVVTAVAPALLGLTRLEAAMLGSVLAAVSPAVVVPLMIKFIEERRGAKKGIPTLVLAAASCDDAVAIVFCTSFVSMYVGKGADLAGSLARIPVGVAVGIAVGLALGYVFYRLFQWLDPRATKRVLVLLASAVLLLQVQELIEGTVPFSALIALMAIGFIILEKSEHVAHEISSKLGKIWVFAQILLFALVGAEVDVSLALNAGLAGLAVIGLGLCGRGIGVLLSLMRSVFTGRERLFVILSYLPKATVQAAIGGLPLAAMLGAGMDEAPGRLILAVAVLSIVVTAPVGAFLIAHVGRRLLPAEEVDSPARAAALESE